MGEKSLSSVFVIPKHLTISNDLLRDEEMLARKYW